MVYDCFIFNDELDLLRLRLLFLQDVVDRFVLVESTRTLSGHPKPLHFTEHKKEFAAFEHKIIHLVCPANDMTAWDYEFYQRNYIKEALKDCKEEDIIFIGDADEIINIKEVLAYPALQLPALIELPMYYYFFDVKTNATFFVNMVANWRFIRDKDIGYRYRDYPKLVNNRLTCNQLNTGWHFSYLFGNNISQYQEKIRSFSHQEYNAPYYLDPKRIKKCIDLAIDIFERPFMRLKKERDSIGQIMAYIRQAGMTHLLSSRSIKTYLSPANILFILKAKYYRRCKYWLQHLVRRNKQDEA